MISPDHRDNMADSDMHVIERVLAGDKNAFEILLQRYSQQVFEVLARRIPETDVEMVAQEVFLSAYRSLGNFQPRQPFGPWLLCIARRRSCDYWRQQAKHRLDYNGTLSDRQREWLIETSHQVAQNAYNRQCEQQEAQDLAHRALEKLDVDDRILVTYLYFEELTTKQVAELLHWSVAKVKIRAYRARQKLYRIIKHWTQSLS